MSETTPRIRGLAEASKEQKLAMIDELWESLRRSDDVEIRSDHQAELAKRVSVICEDPSIALSPAQARALLRL